jgi:transcriptional regulator with XRE-family HTH domain
LITGADLRRARLAKGVGLRRMEKLVNRSRGHLSQVETGKADRPVGPALVLAYATALGDQELLKGEYPAVSVVAATKPASSADKPINGESGVSSDPMKRRTLGIGGASVAAAALLGVQRDRPVADRIGETDVLDLQRNMDRLYKLDYEAGGDSLWRGAGVLADEAQTMLEYSTYTETVGAMLARAAANLHICQGWLAFDAGHVGIARTCFGEALNVGSQIGDGEVESHAMANLAAVAVVLRRPREAARMSEGATRAAEGAPELARLSAVPHLRTTIAAAIDQDAPASEAAIKAARNVIDREADKPTAEWLNFLGPQELDGIEGTAAIELHHYRRADQLLQRAIDGYGDSYRRNRALYLVRQARARCKAKQYDGAAEAASAALDDLMGNLSSWRVTAELDEVARWLAENPTAPGVEAFLTRYRGLRI